MLTSLQVGAILLLLQAFGADATTISNVHQALVPVPGVVRSLDVGPSVPTDTSGGRDASSTSPVVYGSLPSCDESVTGSLNKSGHLYLTYTNSCGTDPKAVKYNLNVMSNGKKIDQDPSSSLFGSWESDGTSWNATSTEYNTYRYLEGLSFDRSKPLQLQVTVGNASTVLDLPAWTTN